MNVSFKHAIEGVKAAFVQHLNFRIHVAIAIVVLTASFVLKISHTELIIVIFTINSVLIVEMMNTSIEEITNLVTLKWSKQAKIAKDVAAGMALITAVSAAVVGLFIFIPRIIDLLS